MTVNIVTEVARLYQVFFEPCPVCHGTGFATPKRLNTKKDLSPPIQPSTETPLCFICYGEPDILFAKKINNALKYRGIQTWMYAMDYTPGQRTWKEIIENRRVSHKFLVICSIASLSRNGVLKEIEQQIDEDLDKIIPIYVDSSWTSPSFRIERGGNNLKPFLLDRNYADFVNKSFDEAISRLVKAIRQSV